MIILAGKATIMTLVVVIVIGMCVIAVSAASIARPAKDRYYDRPMENRHEKKEDRG